MGFVEGLSGRVEVVGYNESWKKLISVLQRNGDRKMQNIQLSLKARVVNASRTEMMFGCRIRLQVSIAANAA